jgi:hypothetical protein
VGMHIRDDRQRKALTGLSQAQFNSLLPVCRDVYQATQQQAYAAGVESGTRRRKPGGGCKGKRPTMAEKRLFVLSYYKTYPTFDVLGPQCELGRAKANEHLPKRSPSLDDTLVELALMPYRELGPPEALQAAGPGREHVLIDATERAYRRSQEAAKQREHSSGTKTASAQEHRPVPPREVDHLSRADVARAPS